MERRDGSLGFLWSTSRLLVELVAGLFVAGSRWLGFVPRSGLHPVPPVRSSSYFCCRPTDPGRGLARFIRGRSTTDVEERSDDTPATPGRGAAHSAFRSRQCRPPVGRACRDPASHRPLVELVETRIHLCCRPTRRSSLSRPRRPTLLSPTRDRALSRTPRPTFTGVPAVGRACRDPRPPLLSPYPSVELAETLHHPSCQPVETVAWFDRLHQRWSYRLNQRWRTTRPREECVCRRVAGARPWFARRSAGSWHRRPSGVPRVGADVRRCRLRPPRPG